MQVTFLTTDEVADLIERYESVGGLTAIQGTASEVVYRIQDDSAAERVLINTSCGSYLITQSV
ncbi:hypothetical protein [Acinetobacter sp. ANC 4640]